MADFDQQVALSLHKAGFDFPMIYIALPSCLENASNGQKNDF